MVGKQHISQHKRLSTIFTEEDFTLLCDSLSGFGQVLITPNILTESSNLLRQSSDPLLSRIMETFKAQIEIFDEYYVKSKVASQEKLFVKFGLTDSAIIALARDKHTVLSVDLELVHYLQGLGLDAVNFNLLRNKNLLG